MTPAGVIACSNVRDVARQADDHLGGWGEGGGCKLVARPDDRTSDVLRVRARSRVGHLGGKAKRVSLVLEKVHHVFHTDTIQIKKKKNL